jgi:hypothetical protein
LRIVTFTKHLVGEASDLRDLVRAHSILLHPSSRRVGAIDRQLPIPVIPSFRKRSGIGMALITSQFRRRGRTLDDSGLNTLLDTADLIPYDVQRIAHELWDYAELRDKRTLNNADVQTVIDKLVIGQSTYYELLWEQLPARQRAALQALAHRGAAEIYSQTVREEFRLGAASTVQKALQSLDSQDVLDRYRGNYFFLDPLLPYWIRTKAS